MSKADSLIESMSRDLKPVTAPWSPVASSFVFALLSSVFTIVTGYALYGDRANALQRLQQPAFLLSVILIYAMIVTASYLCFTLSLPGRRLTATTRMLPWLLLLVLGLAFFTRAGADWVQGFDLGGGTCAVDVSLLSILPTICMLLATRRLAAMDLTRAALGSGLAGATSGLLAVTLFCPSENTVHMLAYHVAPVVVISALCGALFARLLRW